MIEVIFYIIFYLPYIMLVVSFFLFWIGIFQKKRKTIILGTVGLLLFSLQLVNRMRITGEIGSNTKADGMKFQIVQCGTGSLGSHGTYIMKPDGIIVEVDEISEGTNIFRFGWRFEAINQGKCLVIVHQFDGAELRNVNAYQVQTDENLNVRYEQKEVAYPGDIKYFDDSWYVRTNKITINDSNEQWHIENPLQTEEMRATLCRIVGENIECDEPDTSNLAKLIITYEIEDSIQILERKETFYITQEGQVYYKKTQRHNDKETYDQWYLFVPDEWCDTNYSYILDEENWKRDKHEKK